MKMVQIPESLFVELMKYHVLGIEDSLPKIKSGLEEKYEAIMKENYIQNQKQLRLRQNGKRQERHILIRWECIGVFRW